MERPTGRYGGTTQRIVGMVRAHLRAKTAADRDKEHYWVVGLNIDGQVLYIDEASVGLRDLALVDTSSTFRTAISEGAYGVVLVHNHIGDDVRESRDDVEMVRRLQIIGALVGVTVIDAVVINSDRALVSLREKEKLLTERGISRRLNRVL